MSAVRSIGRHMRLLLVTLGMVSLAGCRPAFEASDQAEPWPLLDRDPAETGDETGRWPGWRGKNGSGISPGGNPPQSFGPSKNVRWKVRVPGRGNSSPVVSDRFVLLSSALEKTDPPALAVLCFDRADGALLWQAPAGEARGRTHAKNGHASASVATDGRRIFAFFGSTGLFCCDFSGKQVWHAELGDLDHLWGTAASPVLFRDTVIQLCQSEQDSYLAAFDKATGQPIWRTGRSSGGCWSTPVVIDVAADDGRSTELIVNGGSGRRQVSAYDPADGRQLWRVSGTAEFVAPTPVVCKGLVYCASGRNGPIMAIRPGGSGEVTKTHLVWKTARGGPYIPSGVAYRNRLFLVDDAGRITCYNAGNGRKIWRERLRGPFSASLVAVAGRIYAVNEHGTVYVLAAADSFDLLAENPLDERCLATPAVAGDELLIRTEEHLYCCAEESAAALAERPAGQPAEQPPQARATPKADVPTAVAPGEIAPAATAPKDAWPLFRGNRQATGAAGATLPEKLERLWTFSVPEGGFQSTAAIAEGMVFLGCFDGKLYAIDLSGGGKKWEFPTELGFTASAAVRGGQVFIGDSDGRFYCIDAESGKVKWDFPTEAEINSGANFYKDNVLFGSQDGFLYCLKAGTGKLVWKYESEDMIQCSPTVAGDRAFVAGCDGRLTMVGLAEGKRIAGIDIEAPTLCTPAVLGPTAFVGTTGSALLAVDWQKGEILWRYTAAERPAEFRSSAAVTPQLVVVGSRDKLVHAIDAAVGLPVWTFPTKARVDSSPVIAGDRVFVGSADGRLYALDIKTGELRWQFEAGGSILASPAVAAGRLVIATDEGDVYCFGAKQSP